MRCIVCDPEWEKYLLYNTQNETYTITINPEACVSLEAECSNFDEALVSLETRIQEMINDIASVDGLNFLDYSQYVKLEDSEKQETFDEMTKDEMAYSSLELEIAFDNFIDSYRSHRNLTVYDCDVFDLPYFMADSGKEISIIDFTGLNFDTIDSIKYLYWLIESIKRWAEDDDSGEKYDQYYSYYIYYDTMENSFEQSDALVEDESTSSNLRSLQEGETSADSPKNSRAKCPDIQRASSLKEEMSKNESKMVDETCSNRLNLGSFEGSHEKLSWNISNKTETNQVLFEHFKHSLETQRKSKEKRKRLLTEVDQSVYPLVTSNMTIIIKTEDSSLSYSPLDVAEDADLVSVVGVLKSADFLWIPKTLFVLFLTFLLQ